MLLSINTCPKGHVKGLKDLSSYVGIQLNVTLYLRAFRTSFFLEPLMLSLFSYWETKKASNAQDTESINVQVSNLNRTANFVF